MKLRMRAIAPLLCLVPLALLGKEPYDYLVEFGRVPTRVPGTSGHRQAREYIVDNLPYCEVDSFTAGGVKYYNIRARFGGKGSNRRIGIAGHWDSEPDCPGANDGGSSTALLLSLAAELGAREPDIGVDLIFFDGEDVDDAACIGSEHFAAECVENYSFILVVDMVGDKNLQVFKEANSYKFFPQLVDSIWDLGMEVSTDVFIPIVKYTIKDDHLPLIKYGIRAIDIIDFDYPYWHTMDDTVDKCSRQSMNVMLRFLRKIAYPPY